MHHWITLLYTWNQHNCVNQLYSNIKEKLNKNTQKRTVARQSWLRNKTQRRCWTWQEAEYLNGNVEIALHGGWSRFWNQKWGFRDPRLEETKFSRGHMNTELELFPLLPLPLTSVTMISEASDLASIPPPSNVWGSHPVPVWNLISFLANHLHAEPSSKAAQHFLSHSN